MVISEKKTQQPSFPAHHTKDAPNPDIKIPKHLRQHKEKDEELKTQKTPETIQGEEPIKPENRRARGRRESQLTTAAPLKSSTLRWIPRKNALATWNCRHQEPRTAPIEVV